MTNRQVATVLHEMISPRRGRNPDDYEHTITQRSWDFICHIDDYMAGRITVEEMERHIEFVLRSYIDNGKDLPTIIKPGSLPNSHVWR